MKTKYKIIIADSNTIYREGLKQILNWKDFFLIDEWINLNQINNYFKEKPDLIIIDYSSEAFKTESITLLKNKFPNTKILAITYKELKKDIIKSLKLGIQSHLLKNCDKDEVLEAIYATIEGKNFFCGRVLEILSENKSNNNSCDAITLSKRELEIIQYVAEGFTNKEIAEKLYISTHTVNTHRKNIMQKLGLKNTAEVVIYAVKEKIINL